MMYQQLVARRYAKGLMLAAKADEYARLDEELKDLVGAMATTNLGRLFEDPSFSPIERKKVIDKIADASKMSQILHRFLRLLVEKDRMKVLPAIQEAFVALTDEYEGRMRARVKSATPLDSAQLTAITESLKAISKRDVLTDIEVQPELLGGIRVEMAGMIFDGTVKAKLLGMKHKLLSDIGTR